MHFRYISISLFIFFIVRIVNAQISPGELSRTHEKLEGVNNCTQCHEQGEEITGKKCLVCHTEIRDAISAKHGFHFHNASSTCVNCHKEHLGKDASITLFDKNNFDHKKTGFLLGGKHYILQCAACHIGKFIKDPAIISNLKIYPRQTYLGLRQQCIDCHPDRHNNSLGNTCQLCHTADAWKPAALFSHSKTKFPLIGKHDTVNCIQCHESLRTKDASHPIIFSVKKYSDCNACHKSPHGEKFSKQQCNTCHSPTGWSVVTGFDHSKTDFELTGKHTKVTCEKCHTGLADTKSKSKDFSTKAFRDCTPCHTSPHATSFSKKTCSSCHTTQEWSSIAAKNFDHSLTSFPLRGKHSSLNCDKCHTKEGKQSFKNSFKLAKKNCSDCHTDKHNGQFVKVYSNDCSRCHSEDGYSPSTFSFEQHQLARFKLTNAHLTIPCKDCHYKNAEWKFHFENISCSSCHTDHHNGQFSALMAERSCDLCHSTISWKTTEFDHSKTAFSLIGQHKTVPCGKCHLRSSDSSPVKYKGTSKVCSDCHLDPHAGQFSDKGKTDCAYCHTPVGRRALIFKHETQSTFALTGAHTKVECGACHKPEERNGKVIVRYKPLSTKCESCHQGKI